MKQNDIYERVIRTMIDESREEYVLHDEMYLELEERRSRMENEYLCKYPEAMKLIEDYITLVQETNMRFADISYMCGVKDTISLMVSLKLIREV